MLKQFRRIPALRCEKCGSDKFEMEVSSDGALVVCPLPKGICHLPHGYA